MQPFIKLRTDGSGLWSNKTAAVGITKIEVRNIAEEIRKEEGVNAWDDEDFGEMRVFFDPADWNVASDGLIYTDEQFESELQEALSSLGYSVDDVGYSEQGMQGVDYVSLDIGPKFLESWGDTLFMVADDDGVKLA